MEKFQGKIAVVTGASAGIGAKITEVLLDHGLMVVGLARRKDKIEEIPKNNPNSKGKLFAIKCDVSKEKDIVNAFSWTVENLGPISILINNAGISRNCDIINGNVENWKAVLDINLCGVSIACREAIASMTLNNIDGIIININSVAGHEIDARPGWTMYRASKYAVTALTESLRLELIMKKSKIRITSLSPGVVHTDIFVLSSNITKEEYDKNLSKTPYLQTDDIANAVKYVLSTPENVQITELTIRPVGEMIVKTDY